MNLSDILREISPDDPERRRAEEERRQRLLDQIRDVVSRPQSGPVCPTDKELLGLISDLFHEDEDPTTPFNEKYKKEYDGLIERLSFTAKTLEGLDTAELKTAWTRFLEEFDVDFGWPVNVGMAQWYEDRGMVAHAIAVYEHLYSEIRGRLRDECSAEIEGWLMSLLYLCRDKGLYSRARHLCEVIEDYPNDGVVVFAKAEALAIQNELNHRAIGGTFESDLRSAEERLKAQHGDLFASLHHRTRSAVVAAELWSDAHWMTVGPGEAPLQWSRALEWEFHCKVFTPHKKELEAVLGKWAPYPGETCGVGKIIALLERPAMNLGGNVVKNVLAGCRGDEYLRSDHTLFNLKRLRDDRNAIAHVPPERVYTAADCTELVQTIRHTGWVFKFLAALQPR